MMLTAVLFGLFFYHRLGLGTSGLDQRSQVFATGSLTSEANQQTVLTSLNSIHVVFQQRFFFLKC